MRFRVTKVALVVLNLLLFYNIYRLVSPLNSSASKVAEQKPIPSPVHHTVTLIFRQFEPFDNDLVKSVDSFLSQIQPPPNVLVVSDAPVYPPLRFPAETPIQSLRQIALNINLNSSFEERNPLAYVKTKFVLFLPDSVRLPSQDFLQGLLDEAEKEDKYTLAVPLEGYSEAPLCLSQEFNVKEWTVHLKKAEHGALCDSVLGKHALLLRTETLRKLPDPFMRPFPEIFFLQMSIRGEKVRLVKEKAFPDGRVLYNTGHLQWKAESADNKRRIKAFKELGIKKVIRENGKVEWYGCSKKSQRCFGTVVDDTPEYLMSGRWTPPCCLEALRKTARHVFSALEEAGVRYWLEGGSLLGAMRHNDIIPWDYDVDIGIYEDDISRSTWLTRASTRAVVDDKGFLWEKAQPSEGAFFRVHYSQSNRLHVDIFPFRSTPDGKMTKDFWFPTHPQDCEFPEHFLHPISSISFAGRKVSAPNNVRDFLELKFGKGAIENPQYPNPHLMKLNE
ncbi:ribitol 5-phosphate transferase FKRP [Cloeon dipterum]|uniref:ribitol 5-phosphate transferase FKRP n=1 Tax=Cloeon dipterum TaxID=197152 RepID=UPI00321FEA27